MHGGLIIKINNVVEGKEIVKMVNKKKKSSIKKTKKVEKAPIKKKKKVAPVRSKNKKSGTASKTKKRVPKNNTIVIPHKILTTRPDMLHYSTGETRLTLCRNFIDEFGGIIPLKGNEHLLEKYKDLGAREDFVRGTLPTCSICKAKLRKIKKREKRALLRSQE